MKRAFFTICVALAFLSAMAQGESYIVKTNNVKRTAAVSQDENAEMMIEQQEDAMDFISQNFRFRSLCDWEKGMKFMVMPEKVDLVVKTFTDAATGREVSSMPLKHKIMIYQGHNESADGHSHMHFFCPDNNKSYYFEIPSGTFDDYCFGKLGVPTLAYLGDVDIAKEKLMGKTLFTKTQHFRIDTENDGDGFMEVTVDKDLEVKVVNVGVGTRSFPVKIIVEDKDGNQFFQNVAISKTNSGMRDDEFIMDNTKFLFGGSFELQDDIMAVNEYNYRVYLGKVIHTKYPTKMVNETTKKLQSIPRLAEYQVETITPHKNDNAFTLKLKNTTLGTFFFKDVLLDPKKVENDVDYFGYLFAPGPGKKVETSESSRAMIRSGHVGIGFSEDEVQMAAGEPDKVEHGQNGQYTWIFNRSNNKLLYVDFDGTGTVSKTYTKDATPKRTATRRKATTTRRRTSSSSWQNNKGTPL